MSHLPPEALTAWLARVSELYGLAGEVAPTSDVSAVLDVARDVARGVARPAAPVTTFLLGLAVGRRVPEGAEVGPVLADLAAQVQALALAGEPGGGEPSAGEPGEPGPGA